MRDTYCFSCSPSVRGRILMLSSWGGRVSIPSTTLFHTLLFHLGSFTTLLFDDLDSVFLKNGRQRLHLLNHFLRGHDSTQRWRLWTEISFAKRRQPHRAGAQNSQWISFVFACQFSTEEINRHHIGAPGWKLGT